MDRALLDTDIFSEVIKAKDPLVSQGACVYRQMFGRYTLSTITVTELVKGFQKRSREDRVVDLLAAIADEEILALDVAAAVTAGRIFGELEKAGLPIGRADPLIAAIAIEHDLPLVTGNTKHFERVTALGFPLRLLDWRTV